MRRAIALEFVRGLLESGYTVERADHESLLGFDACDGSERSYLIRHGQMIVPYRGDGEKFSFGALAREALVSPARPVPPPRPCPVGPSLHEQMTLI